MNCTVVDFGKDSIVYNISGTSREELDNRLNLFFSSQNLKMKKDKPEEKVFQRGSAIARMLLGVFVKYFKVLIVVSGANDVYSVKLKREMNFFMSGGAIGLMKARKEFERLNEDFKTYFTN